jgi:hypothetical protein
VSADWIAPALVGAIVVGVGGLQRRSRAGASSESQTLDGRSASFPPPASQSLTIGAPEVVEQLNRLLKERTPSRAPSVRRL